MIPTGTLKVLNENESEERTDDSMMQSSHADIVIENVINNPYRRWSWANILGINNFFNAEYEDSFHIISGPVFIFKVINQITKRIK